MDFRDAFAAESCMAVLFDSNFNRNPFLQSVQAEDDGVWPAYAAAQLVVEDLSSKDSDEVQRSVMIQRAQQRRQDDETRKVPTVISMLAAHDSRVEPLDSSLFVPVKPEPAVPQFLSRLSSTITKSGSAATKTFKVFMASKEVVSVNLKLADDVQACIRAAVDAASSSGLLTNCEYQAFDLCILESPSGTPDLDFGTLKCDRPIDSFGETSFALVPKKGFVATTDVGTNNKRSATVVGMPPALFLQKENSRIFRVMLPDKPSLKHMYELDQVLLNQISNPFVTITVSKTAKASELLLAVCKKGHRGFFPEDHVLAYLDDNGAPACNDDGTPITIPSLLPVSELKSQTIALLRRVYQDVGRAFDRAAIVVAPDGHDNSGTRAEGAATHEVAEAKFNVTRRGSIFTPSLASHYSRREYSIVKVNKRGTRQDRILSVDSNVIRMAKPKSKGFAPFSSTVKHPEIPFASLRRYWRPKGLNKQVRIYFESPIKDQQAPTQDSILELEFETMAEADEFASCLSAFEIPFEQQ
jgi:hypothetical protein